MGKKQANVASLKKIQDLGRLLRLYQLWLHDVYPRAKFRDLIGMIEKLGHTRQFQIMREEWILEFKGSLHDENEVGRRC